MVPGDARRRKARPTPSRLPTSIPASRARPSPRPRSSAGRARWARRSRASSITRRITSPAKNTRSSRRPTAARPARTWTAWDESWAYAHQLLCQRGAFILKPNYHGSSNYGLKFVESICCGKYYDYPVEDIEKGVDSLIAKGLVDPGPGRDLRLVERLDPVDRSVSVANPDRYKVVAAGAGRRRVHQRLGQRRFRPLVRHLLFRQVAARGPASFTSASRPSSRWTRSRRRRSSSSAPRTGTCPTSQGWTHYRALYHLGKVPVKFLLFPGEPHGLQEYTHQLRKLDEEMAWFDRWFFKTEKAENEALKPDSPLAQAAPPQGDGQGRRPLRRRRRRGQRRSSRRSSRGASSRSGASR